MGRPEDEENLNNNNNLTKKNLNTQPIDCQFMGEEDDAYRYITSTMPVDDTYLLEDAFETQLVNLGGETQVIDLGGETQVIDLAGDTQVIDLAGETQVLDDLDSLKNFSIECLDEFNAEVDAVSDNEGANETQPVFETQELFEDDTVKMDGGDSIGQENTVDIYSAKRGEDVSAVPSNLCSNEEHSSGSLRGGFTSMRVASFIASGLAARARRTSKILHSTSSDKSSLEHQTVEKRLQNEYNEVGKQLRDVKKTKVVSKAVRKLFTEDNLDTTETRVSENCLTGLSYVDSQEPGELSQAHALEVVDKFLDLNVMEFDQGFNSSRVHIVEKPTVVSVAKGSRDLAKSSILKSKDVESGVYDWDDTREDDGGGDFFLKKKELFFKAVGDHKDGKMQNVSKAKIGGSLLHKLRAKGKSVYREEVFHKNLRKDFDDVASMPKLADNDTSKDIHDMANVGPDTQMAAEAMETLCLEKVNLAENSFDGHSKCARSTRKATKKKKSSNETACKTLQCPSSVRVVTRQSKQIQMTSFNASNECLLSSKQSKNIKGHDTVPVAQRTRQCTEISRSGMADSSVDVINARVMKKRRIAAKDERAEMGNVRKIELMNSKQSKKSHDGRSGASNIDRDDLKGKRTRQEMLDTQCNSRVKRSRNVARSVSVNPGNNHNTRSKKTLLEKNVEKEKASSNDAGGPTKSKLSDAKSDARERCATPVTYTTPVNKASPICMGNEYYTQSCRKRWNRFSLIKEIDKLVCETPRAFDGSKCLRKRKDIASIRVLFSQHLDVGVVKQQKKILARMGGTVASSVSDATHFVADEFVRTRNMLEAIAFGKPVITHSWLGSCGQASCLIDEKNYILRDAKKEKEFGFCLPDSLSRARQHPLLQGQKILVTANTKPGKDILSNLVKAVHGLAVERLGRLALKDEKLPDDLLILSCEEDYDICVPFLEKGCAVYSSELLLNGIVKQKLEYERHRLFADHVKRTRSTIWVKKKNRYLPVTKCK